MEIPSWVVPVVAVYAAVLSTMVFYVQQREKNSRLRVRPALMGTIEMATGESCGDLVCIDIINTGEIAVFVVDVRIVELRYPFIWRFCKRFWRVAIIPYLGLHGHVPMKLDRAACKTIRMPAQAFLESLARTGFALNKSRLMAVDTLERCHYSKPLSKVFPAQKNRENAGSNELKAEQGKEKPSRR